jgi:hypothetical protein
VHSKANRMTCLHCRAVTSMPALLFLYRVNLSSIMYHSMCACTRDMLPSLPSQASGLLFAQFFVPLSNSVGIFKRHARILHHITDFVGRTVTAQCNRVFSPRWTLISNSKTPQRVSSIHLFFTRYWEGWPLILWLNECDILHSV